MSEVISAVIGAIVGFGGTYLLFLHQRKLEARAKFREAFAEDMALCKSKAEFKIRDMLTKSLVKHESAVILFEPYLGKGQRQEFFQTWEKYCELLDYSPLNDFVPESGLGVEGYIRELTEVEQRDNSFRHLIKIISFAKVR